MGTINGYRGRHINMWAGGGRLFGHLSIIQTEFTPKHAPPESRPFFSSIASERRPRSESSPKAPPPTRAAPCPRRLDLVHPSHQQNPGQTPALPTHQSDGFCSPGVAPKTVEAVYQDTEMADAPGSSSKASRTKRNVRVYGGWDEEPEDTAGDRLVSGVLVFGELGSGALVSGIHPMRFRFSGEEALSCCSCSSCCCCFF